MSAPAPRPWPRCQGVSRLLSPWSLLPGQRPAAPSPSPFEHPARGPQKKTHSRLRHDGNFIQRKSEILRNPGNRDLEIGTGGNVLTPKVHVSKRHQQFSRIPQRNGGVTRTTAWSLFAIVIAQLNQNDPRFHLPIHHPVFLRDPPRPIAGQGLPQRLRLADSLLRRPECILYEFVDSLQNLFISLLPILILLPGLWREGQVHASRSISFSTSLPCSAALMESKILRAFAGLRSR